MSQTIENKIPPVSGKVTVAEEDGKYRATFTGYVPPLQEQQEITVSGPSRWEAKRGAYDMARNVQETYRVIYEALMVP